MDSLRPDGKGPLVIDAADLQRLAAERRVDGGRLEIEYVAVADVQQHPDNPNNGDTAAIADSIRRNGLYTPLIVQRDTGYILAGNHRYVALVSLGVGEVPVIYRDVTEEQARRIMVADNRTNRLGFDDPGLLFEQLEMLYETDLGLAGTGFSDTEYLKLLDEVGVLDTDDEDAFEQPPEPAEDEVQEDEEQVLAATPMRFWIEPDIDPDGKVRVLRITKQEGKAITARDFNTIRGALGHDPLTLEQLHEYGIDDWGKLK